jgi:lipopolysaccharide/colanic/teichoic acid biosynthesis glycosyltransferase
LLIKLESRGPVFFIQKRSGKDDEPFWCFKFRSMKVNTESDEVQATKDDPRITRIGAFMRRTSLDELPQFFNVFLGNMSICGPRPHMLLHTKQYSTSINKFMVRHLLKPGITGWAQVNGLRGETESPELMQKRVEYDLWYMENWSLMLDVKILFMTIINMFKGEKNAY